MSRGHAALGKNGWTESGVPPLRHPASGACALAQCRAVATADDCGSPSCPARADRLSRRSTAGPRTITPRRSRPSSQSCRAILRGTQGDARGAAGLRRAVRSLPQGARGREPHDAAQARAFFEQNFRPVRISPLGEPTAFSPATTSRSSTARATPSRRTCLRRPPLLRGGRVLNAAPSGKSKSEGAAHGAGCAVSRARDRRRRARRPQSRNLLAEGSDRRVLRPHPGLGAGAARRRQDAAAELRRAATAIPIRGRPLPDRAQDRPQGRDVDGPHPAMDGGQSGGGQGAAAARTSPTCSSARPTWPTTRSRSARRASR